jgi:hypothetical protein
MRKLVLAVLVLGFAGACAHKSTTNTDAKPADAATTSQTKDQSTPMKKHHHHKSSVSTAATVKCTRHQDERTIEIKDKDGGCETIYTKMGEAKSIASSSHGEEHCKDVSAKIQGHLSSAGFTCQ